MLRVSYLGLGLAALIVSGCNHEPPPQAKSETATKVTKVSEDQHPHKPGAHNGIIVPLGQDSYHAEAVFEKNGILRLYTLQQDETRILEVDAAPVQAFVKIDGDLENTGIVFRPEPQDGDAKGKTSQFVAQLPREYWNKAVEVSIPNFRIGSERFRIGFTNATASHGEPMPKGVGGDEEQKLYLQPGGIYTAADIKANGNMTASQKFKGIKAQHDMNPKAGEKICPITDTKANPRFTWVVNGQAYEFCCPPCVDEFVTRAKTDPQSIKAPADYVKK